MSIVFRCMTVCFLVCLMVPHPVQAGGDAGKGPYEIGEKYYARKEYGTALKYYRKALEQNDPRAHYRMGLISEDAGKDREALGHYQRLMDLDRPDAQRSDVVRRVAAIEERLKKKTTRSTDLLERGKNLFMQGKYREAEKVLLQAASKDTSNPEIHFYLGEVYMELEDFGRATAEYKKVKGKF